jgi:chemotaxis protein MotA
MMAGCLAVVFLFESQSSATGFWRLLHWPAMVLTGAGPLAMILISYDLNVIGRTMKWLFRSAEKRQKFLDREAIMLYRVGRAFYTEGPDAFDRLKPKGVSETARKVVERLSVRIPTPDIADVVARERDKFLVRTVQTLNVIGMGVKLSPSIGMLGTILGMVSLLSTLQDPTHLGDHMSLALLTTFYGLFFSIVIWTPLQQKIERLMDMELEGYDQILRWLELLEKRKPTDYFAEGEGLPVPKSESAAA